MAPGRFAFKVITRQPLIMLSEILLADI